MEAYYDRKRKGHSGMKRISGDNANLNCSTDVVEIAAEKNAVASGTWRSW